MAKITGGELLVKCLVNQGVTKVFGIPGGQLTTFIDAIARLGPEEGIEFVMTRHESANAYMADAWHRVTGGLAVCTGTILSLIHISEPTRLGMISYAVFCLKKKKRKKRKKN